MGRDVRRRRGLPADHRRPPDAETWPDERSYPALVPPRVYVFLVAHAREQHGRPLPARWAKHRATQPHRCYANAAAVALRNLHVTYTEGVAFTDAGARPIPHAWLTDSASEIVDLSPWLGASYYGVPMPAAVYADASRTA